MAGLDAVGIAAIVSAAAAVGGTAYGVVAGEEGKRDRKKGLALQAQAQDSAAARARRADQQAEIDRNKAAAGAPDIAALLAAATKQNKTPTLLTGPAGLDPATLQLGRKSLLGG